jgi:hypothetical protein
LIVEVPPLASRAILRATDLIPWPRDHARWAPRSRLTTVWRTHRLVRVVCQLGIAGFAILVAGRAANLYYQSVSARFAADEVPYDLATFLRASSNVLDGVSPYAFRGDQTYAYPPFLAIILSPLNWLSSSAVTLAWPLLSLAAIALALWLLEVRDWRCYALAANYPFVKSAVLTGAAVPLLLLGVALGWRWRDDLLKGGAAVGAAVAVKLFLWPLALWLVVARRARTAAAALGCAVAAALIPWAAIGFAGLGEYPALLRRLTNEEATSSFSLVAIGVRAHLPESLATALSAIIAIGLIGMAYRIARGESLTPREQDALTLTFTLAAALAASPIVWAHSFLLLLVPLALIEPRLSPFWLLPFAYAPIQDEGWPSGDAPMLIVALIATTAMIVSAVARAGRHADRTQEHSHQRFSPRLSVLRP